MEVDKWEQISKLQKRRIDLCGRLSMSLNVLGYYATIGGCDVLMCRLSHNSRKLWKDNLKYWIIKLNEDTKPVEINFETMQTYIENTLFKNCCLVLDLIEILDETHLSLIIKFIKSLPNKEQIKKIVLKCSNDRNKIYDDQTISSNLCLIEKALGSEQPELNKYTNNKGENIQYFYSSIICAESIENYIHGTMRVFPKINGTNRVICINSKFIVAKDYILITDYTNYPDHCQINSESHQLPIFGEETKIEVRKQPRTSSLRDSHHDSVSFSDIINKCYPKVKEMTLKQIISGRGCFISFVCEALQQTNIKRCTFDHYPLTGGVKIKAKEALIFPRQRAYNTCNWYKCDVEAVPLSFRVYDEGYILAYEFTLKSLSNCTRSSSSPITAKHPRLGRAMKECCLHFSEVLCIPIQGIYEVEDISGKRNYFTTCNRMKVLCKLRDVKMGIYDKLNSSCVIKIGTYANMINVGELSNPTYYEEIIQGRESNIIFQIMMTNSKFMEFKEYDAEYLKKLKRFHILILLDTIEEETAEDKIISKLQEYSKLPNIGDIKICPIKCEIKLKENTYKPILHPGNPFCITSLFQSLKLPPHLTIRNCTNSFFNP